MKKIVLAILSIAVIFAVFFVFYENPNIVNFQSLFPENSTPTPTLSVTSAPTPDSTNTPTSTPSLTSSPALSPTSYGELVDYTLSLINSDRQQNGLQNVTLSNIDSGQLHADNMLKNRYVSHWDVNGNKPYMRYTLADGQGAVAENIAWEGETGNAFGIDVKTALRDMEYGMMHNDSASNWGHRDNILNPLHNEINIGLAYDNHNVYFVEDFEDDYVQWSTLSSSGSQVQMSGTVAQTNFTLSQVAIYYDNVSNLTVQQLSSSPYHGSYDSGTSVGIVVPPGWNA